ncbi:hypothetical protein C8R43DRAFT_1129942 [Mycena crocata]|nr:hypothetical protein C8R43DRAFT_1129942 [Mycena crocata]
MNQTLREAAARTAQRLASLQTHPGRTKYLPQRALLLGDGVREPNETTSKYLTDLAGAARAAADGVACGSILAGHTSEGNDDFADVAVWLGDGAFGAGNERAVLHSLGLESNAVKISSVGFSTSLKGVPATVSFSGADSTLSAFDTAVTSLSDMHCFSFQPPSSSDVVYSLVGRHATHGWGGLVGVGVWSDLDE